MLFEPYQVRELVLCNKTVIPPRSTRLAEPGINEVTDQHLVHYGRIAQGGYGLVMVESVAVEMRGRLCTADLGLWDDRFIPGLRRLVQYVHENTPAKIGVLLAHAGRRGPITPVDEIHLGGCDPLGAECISSSDIPFAPDYNVPQRLTQPDIEGVLRSYEQAAQRAIAAGFDLLEIQMGDGGLLHGFLSPNVNTRLDKYGGSLQDRARLPVMVLQRVRQAIPPNTPVTVRLCCSDRREGTFEEGFTLSEALIVAASLQRSGADLISVTAGGVRQGDDLIPDRSLAWPLAAAFKQEGISTIALGGFEDLAEAEMTLKAQETDLIAVTEAHNNPYWLRLLAMEHGVNFWVPSHEIGGVQPSQRDANKSVETLSNESPADNSEHEAVAVSRIPPAKRAWHRILCC